MWENLKKVIKKSDGNTFNNRRTTERYGFYNLLYFHIGIWKYTESSQFHPRFQPPSPLKFVETFLVRPNFRPTHPVLLCNTYSAQKSSFRETFALLEGERPNNLICRIKTVVALVVYSRQAIIFCCIYATMGYNGNIVIQQIE